MKHDGKGNHELHYRLYTIREEMGLKDAITAAVAFDDFVQSNVLNKREAYLGDVDPSYMPDEKNSADSDGSRNTVIAELARERDEKGYGCMT